MAKAEELTTEQQLENIKSEMEKLKRLSEVLLVKDAEQKTIVEDTEAASKKKDNEDIETEIEAKKEEQDRLKTEIAELKEKQEENYEWLSKKYPATYPPTKKKAVKEVKLGESSESVKGMTATYSLEVVAEATVPVSIADIVAGVKTKSGGRLAASPGHICV